MLTKGAPWGLGVVWDHSEDGVLIWTGRAGAQDAQGAGASVCWLREEVTLRCCWLLYPALAVQRILLPVTPKRHILDFSVSDPLLLLLD